MKNYLRPHSRAVVDITTRGGVGPFAKIPATLSFRKNNAEFLFRSKAYASAFTKSALIGVLLSGMLSGWVLAPMVYQPQAVSAGTTEDTQRALEEELKGIEAEIAQYQDTIDDLQGQSKTLKSEINKLDSRVKQFNLRIKAANLSLAKLNKEIEETQNQVSTTEGEIQLNKGALSDALRVIYQEEDVSMVELLLKNPNFSDFFGEINSLFSIQNTTRLTIQKVTELKNRLLDQKETLSLERSDVVDLKAFNESQSEALSKTLSEKDLILKQTKGQESRYQDLLKKSIQTAAELRSRIFSLLGGGELTFEEAVRYAMLAEKATGVRTAMLLAILDRESALGKNVGRCKYNEINPRTGKQTMHPTRDVPIFLELTKELGLNPEAVVVSCANKDGVYGGAMGPSQFIPSTWDIYKSRIVSAGGHNPPSPWNNMDAFLATAIYLKELGADAQTTSAERIAAAKYYAGRRWRTFLWTYGDWVANRANAYQKDIAILES